MLFDSPVYIAFLTIVVVLYWRLSRKTQNQWLLAASYFFYGWWDWRFLSLIAASTLVDFYSAKLIAGSQTHWKRRALLTLSLALNLSFLAFFKYFNFFAGSLVNLLAQLHIAVDLPFIEVVLPPGISFYTFQAIAFIVDVYSGRLEPPDSLVDYALFISFFPHLIAGPIQRPGHLLPQTQRERTYDSEFFFNGIQLFMQGLFRKCVVADNCALLANAAFDGRLGPLSIPVVALGTYAFAWQIYGDFSGYSDMARGGAQMLGFHFMVNFQAPYLATSLKDFWRRWHISLSTWLRDYLYIPLGGSRGTAWMTYRNLLLTMVIGGLWHGANWTFLVWGAIHGIGLAIERMWGEPINPIGRARRWLQRAVVFHLVCLSWIFFRAESLPAAVAFLQGLLIWNWRDEYYGAALFLTLFTIPLFVLDYAMQAGHEEYLLQKQPHRLRIAAATLACLVVALMSGSQANAFIYFQF